MRKLAITLVVMLASTVLAGDTVWQLPATVTTSAVNRVADCQAFVGELDEVTIYGAAGATGTLTLSVVDTANSTTLTIATNAALTTAQKTWRPRLVAPAVTGVAALTVTNSGDRILVSGETLRATLAGVTGTNAVIRFRAKYIKE
jgi:hypothetical protein